MLLLTIRETGPAMLGKVENVGKERKVGKRRRSRKNRNSRKVGKQGIIGKGPNSSKKLKIDPNTSKWL